MRQYSGARESNRFEEVKDGPKPPYQRDCTDFLCCLLMLLNMCILLAFALFGYARGGTSNLYRATD
jgi:hypothetical protein